MQTTNTANAPNPRRRRLTRRLTILFVLLVGLIAFGGLMMARSQGAAGTVEATDPNVTVAETTTVQNGTLTLTLDAVGSLQPTSERTLSFGASAPVAQVLVSAGDYVQAGTVLAMLDTTDAEARIRQSQLSLAQKQASLDELLAPPADIDIKLAQAQLTLAQAQQYSAASNGTSPESVEIARLQTELARNSLWQAQINRDMRVEQQEARGSMTWVQQQEFDSSVNQAENKVTTSELDYQDTLNSSPNGSSLISAQASVASAQAKLDSLTNGASQDDIRAAQIAVERAQLSLDSAESTLENYAIVAPFDGIIAEENLTVGTLPGTSPITMIDISTYTLDLSVAESDVVNVSLGQPVSLSLEALPSATVTGKVTRLDVSPTDSSNGLVTYTAQVTLDPAPDVPLRPSMTATATVTLKQLENVIVVPNRFITTDDTTGAATVMLETAPGTYTATPVTIGERNAESSEITSGLTLGQTLVIIASPSASATQATGGFSLFGGAGGGPPGGGNFSPPAGGGGGAGFSRGG